MNTALHHQFAGMGAASPSAQMAVQYGTAAAQAVVPVVLGHTVATLLGLATTAAAVPIIGVAIAGISLGIELIMNSGCGQTCIVTSQWANQAEAQLQQNISAYFAIPIPRPTSVQQIAMANFKAVWNELVRQCTQPNLGTAGQNCIADRQDGACKWKAKAPAFPGEPALGACWNWWNGYYYPIANDPNTVQDTLLSSSTAPSVGSVLGMDPNTLLLIGGVAAAGFLLMEFA